ncbi:hypothetical protein M427DRAFT_72189 [Gonapodya prolifera JEL478]|uniref:Transmembrane protein n=1 Tax=Gonapodya prolifera (strain JEL478) TaxID=1344416 RepID=A0A139A5Z9_GONPJ|nr:hypothetical protein M427DRAFT_72189 [Gonapodya prolifera JEL478]|eukprot:KXS12222.1 hypothetical protein M427DRAFT_72189 [Gonapodya prolifera JEL478]
MTTRNLTNVSKLAVHGSVATRDGRGEPVPSPTKVNVDAVTQDPGPPIPGDHKGPPASDDMTTSDPQRMDSASAASRMATVGTSVSVEAPFVAPVTHQKADEYTQLTTELTTTNAGRIKYDTAADEFPDVDSSIGRTATTMFFGRRRSRPNNLISRLLERRVSTRSAGVSRVDLASSSDETRTAADDLSSAGEDWDERGERGAGDGDADGMSVQYDDEHRTRDESEAKVAKDQSMPLPVRRMFFFGIVLATIQTLFSMAFFCAMIVALTRTERRADSSGGVSAVVTEYDTVLKLGTMSYLFMQLFEYWMYLSSVTTANQAEL